MFQVFFFSKPCPFFHYHISFLLIFTVGTTSLFSVQVVGCREKAALCA
jgi:hypothetical protein